MGRMCKLDLTLRLGDVYTHFLFWASFFLEYFFENPAQKRINLAFLSTFLSKLIPFEQFIPFLSTFLSTFLSNIQQKYFFEHFFEYSKKYSKCWVLFWVLFWELFWGFFWDFRDDKTYLIWGKSKSTLNKFLHWVEWNPNNQLQKIGSN